MVLVSFYFQPVGNSDQLSFENVDKKDTANAASVLLDAVLPLR